MKTSTDPLPSSDLISAASERPGDDPIFALHAEATRRAAQGEQIINATLGALHDEDGRLAVLPTVRRLIAEAPAETFGYAPISGSAPFLSGVIGDALGEGVLGSASAAVATPGGTGACYAAIVNFLEPNQRLLTTDLHWSPYGILAEHARRGIDTFRMFEPGGGFDLEALAAGIDDQMKRQGRLLLLLNTPCHNPTGYTLDRGEWARLVDLLLAASERGPVALVLDYAYAAFAPGSADVWRPEVERLLGRVTLLTAWTASKSFALYGGRVGALIATHSDPTERDRLARAMSFSCRGTWSNGNHLGQWVVGRAFEDREIGASIHAERDLLFGVLAARVEAFNERARAVGLPTPRYEGGFFVCSFTRDARAAAARARDGGVFVVPLQGALRVALCSIRLEDIPRLVDVVAASLEEVQ